MSDEFIDGIDLVYEKEKPKVYDEDFYVGDRAAEEEDEELYAGE